MKIITWIILAFIVIGLIVGIRAIIKKSKKKDIKILKPILAFIGVLLSMFVGAASWGAMMGIIYQTIFKKPLPDVGQNPIDVIMYESQWLGAFIFLILWNKYILKFNLTQIGFHKKKFLKMYSIGALISFCWVTLVFAFIVLTGASHTKLNFTSQAISITIAYAFTFALQGMCEEIQFRGMLFNSLSEKYSNLISILVSGTLFSIVHSLNNGITIYALLNIAVVGYGFAYIYSKTRSLWLLGAIHSTWNFFQGPVFGAIVSGNQHPISLFKTTPVVGKEIINGGTFGFEGGIITTIVSLTFIAIFYFVTKKKDLIVK